ncbi:hypothetical protein FGADI_5738 [Fusarium gaditjirri]|uniref:Cytochrome P450 monooxygenase n=1 Tax=Fusarium gaditjirri TaxID=282569 RepID=A0A8H4T9A9_9HYPO|nr:hypothetical protein FGADI_5738 [Fusarium gaditjirri]
MNSLLLLALWAAGSWIVFSIVNSYWPYLRYDARCKTNGYQRTPRMPSKYTLAIDFLVDAIEENKKKRFHETPVKRYGKHYPTERSRWAPPIDVQVLFFRLTVDKATEFLFGKSVPAGHQSIREHCKSMYFGERQIH